MKQLIDKTAFLVLFVVLGACGDETNTKQESSAVDNEKEPTKKIKSKEKSTIGNVDITLNGKTYKLELARCNSRITEKNSLFLINTKKQKDNPKAPFFTSQGTNGKGFGASYSFLPEGSEMDGGTKYFGEMPFELFKNNNIIFKGEAKSFHLGDGITAIKGVAPIEFKVSCN